MERNHCHVKNLSSYIPKAKINYVLKCTKAAEEKPLLYSKRIDVL